jgi:hypothetical protein
VSVVWAAFINLGNHALQHLLRRSLVQECGTLFSFMRARHHVHSHWPSTAKSWGAKLDTFHRGAAKGDAVHPGPASSSLPANLFSAEITISRPVATAAIGPPTTKPPVIRAGSRRVAMPTFLVNTSRRPTFAQFLATSLHVPQTDQNGITVPGSKQTIFTAPSHHPGGCLTTQILW